MTSAMAGPMLAVDVTVRRDVFEVTAAFEAAAQQTVAILGPNGSGKSTIVAAIAGLLPPSAGTIEMDGELLDAPPAVHVPPERRPIGVMFQDLLLFPHLSALDNVAFPLRARNLDRARARATAARLLERLELGDRAGARPVELSGGEAQRVALARALVAEPRLLLLDEPLSSLDASVRVRTRELLKRELAGFPGIRVIVTHDPVDATVLADRLVIVEEGRVVQIDAPEEIRAKPRSRYAADLVGLNSFHGSLTPLEDGVGRLTTREGEVVVPWPAGWSGRDAIGLLRPADVTLSLERPAGSARNVFQGRVTSIAVDGDRARVRIASSPPLVAELTPGSVRRLELNPGSLVWASFKAVEVEILPA